jgi:hypothetical protein
MFATIQFRIHWKDNIKMDREIGCGVTDWSDLIQKNNQWRTFVNTVMSFRVPKDIGKFLRC